MTHRGFQRGKKERTSLQVLPITQIQYNLPTNTIQFPIKIVISSNIIPLVFKVVFYLQLFRGKRTTNLTARLMTLLQEVSCLLREAFLVSAV